MTAFRDRTFCSAIFDFIREQELFDGGPCLLAVSGGLDSMVLLDFFRRFGTKKYKLSFAVAHLDHGLHADSAAFARWLGQFCEAAGIPFYSHRIAIVAQPEQSSIEAVARSERYAWLAGIAREHGYGRVVTAHSASDQLETVLMRLIRGGIAGLAGMRPSRPLEGTELKLIRPLLATSRAQIAAYARARQLEWCEDPGNQSPDYFRNRVRSRIVPWLLAENPALESLLGEAALIWADEQDWLAQTAAALADRGVRSTAQGLEIEAGFLLELPVALQRCLIRELLRRHLGQWKIYTHAHIEAIRHLAAGPGGKRLQLPGDLLVSKHKGLLRLGDQRQP